MVTKLGKVLFLERLRTLEIEGEIANKPSKKGNSFFSSKCNSYTSVNSSDISYNQFPSSTPSCPQNLGHHLSIISEEIEALDKIINQSLQCITRDSTKECVSIETQTGDVSSTEYVDSRVGTNNDLFVMVVNKGTQTDSDCHQLIGTLRETISLLKDEGATSKHFHHYIQPTLNEKNVKTDIAVLHMGTNDILNVEGDKDLIVESVKDMCKNVFGWV